MKVYISCKSLLLQKSVEMFLRNKLSPLAKADIIISDYAILSQKPAILIGNSKNANLRTPFNKTKLLTTLEKFYEERQLEILTIDGANEFEEEVQAAVSEFSKKIKKIFAKRLYDALKQNKN